MKKSLVALAVLAASGASFAQSSVTVYGTIDAALAHVTATGSASQNLMLSGAVATSVWGLKGSEDLGGGLKANFKLEQEFKGDTGAAVGSGFSREAWVGFSGGFGEVKLGKVSAAYNDIEAAAGAVFGSPVMGPIGLVFQSDAYQTGRTKNTIYYSTPTVSGMTGSVSYGLDEKNSATPGDETKSLGVSYAAGPLYVGAGYQSEKASTAATAVTMSQLNVTYDLGVVTLLGALGHAADFGTTSNDKADEWQIGVNMPVSAALTASAGYASSTTKFGAGGADSKHTAFSVGGAYSLSKRTTAYAALSSDKVDTTDVTTNKYGIGVIHKF